MNILTTNTFKQLTQALSLALIVSTGLGFQQSIAATPTAPKLAAKAYILQDFNSGLVLADFNADLRIEPASLTKMMATYVVEHEIDHGNLKLTDKVKISVKAWKMQGSSMFLEPNHEVTVAEVLKGIIVQSGNDATIALAEMVAGSEESFVSLMNGYARELGMTGTHFTNATGWPHKDHYTTVKDLAILSIALIRDFPDHYQWYSEKEFTYNGIHQNNRNRLLWQDKFVDGIKTGHTDSAGYCLAASAKRGDMRLVSIVVGTKTEAARSTESQKLLTYGFRFFETHKLYSAGDALAQAKVWKGDVDTVPLGLAQDLYITIPRGKYDDLRASMSIYKQIVAPAKQGDTYGSVNLTLDKEPFMERKLVALKQIARGGMLGNLVDDVMLMFE